LTRALKSLSPGDELVVWKLDRFGRSMLEMINIIVDLDRRGIGFRCRTQSFDTRTAIGRGVLAMVAAVAEDELERTKAGMKAAKRRGAKIGRPRKLSPAEVRRARHLIESGSQSRVSVAAGLGVHVGTLRRALAV
jgi:DNA invertase Pin-like site-specific DNA recombinase